jgi:hypothetical protein
MEDGLKMNKDNLKTLIEAIKLDGRTKFNMSVFLGKLNTDYFEADVFEHGELASGYSASRVTSVIPGTNMFNCTSMGCIAGFATAIANNWKAPEWLVEDEPMAHINMFERTSNEFLGFAYYEGRNLYFADDRCIWKWLMQNEPNRYPKLELEGYGDMDSAYEEGLEWDDDDLSIDFTSIDYLTAVDVLTRIMNEEIGLSNEEGYPYYINEKAVVS